MRNQKSSLHRRPDDGIYANLSRSPSVPYSAVATFLHPRGSTSTGIWPRLVHGPPCICRASLGPQTFLTRHSGLVGGRPMRQPLLARWPKPQPVARHSEVIRAAALGK